MFQRRASILGTLVLLFLIVAGTIAFASEDAPETSAASTIVAVREVMASGFPENANGQVLQLLRTIVPAGVVLPMHTHPGMQIAWIESGVLNYTVVSGGSVPITRNGMEGSSAPPEILGPGETTDLHPGDTVAELDGVVHYGQNLGTAEVVIWSAVLLDPDQPAAVVFTPDATPIATPAGD